MTVTEQKKVKTLKRVHKTCNKWKKILSEVFQRQVTKPYKNHISCQMRLNLDKLGSVARRLPHRVC